MLAAIAALAEFPDAVKGIFEQQTLAAVGNVQMYLNGGGHKRQLGSKKILKAFRHKVQYARNA